MSIATAIQNAQGKVADCYTAISEKGGTLPATQNLSNMPTAINSIPSGGGSINNQDKTITTNGTYTADEGYTGLGTVTVSVENNKKKFGLTIDDLIGDLVNGKYTLKKTVDVDVSFDGLTSVEKIGSTGTIGSTKALWYLFTNSRCIRSITFPDFVTISSTPYTFDHMCYSSASLQSVSFPVLQSTDNYSFSHSFESCKNLTSVSFPSLGYASGNAFSYAFSACTSLTSISFPSLTSAGRSTFYGAFSGCTSLTSISFPELTAASQEIFQIAFQNATGLVNIEFPKISTFVEGSSGSNFQQAFSGATSIENIYFPAVISSSFNSTCFSNMLTNTGTSVTHTIHFPSNVETAVQGLNGYPLFGGTSGYVVLAFDLPATE